MDTSLCLPGLAVPSASYALLLDLQVLALLGPILLGEDFFVPLPPVSQRLA